MRFMGKVSDAKPHGVDEPRRRCPALTPEQALRLAEEEPLSTLLDSAESLRAARFGNRIELCAIISAKSGNCGMDCRFCSQSSHNSAPSPVFPLLSNTELQRQVDALRQYPVARCGLVTSGVALASGEFEHLLDFIAGRSRNAGQPEPTLCASLGRLPPHNLARLRRAGLSRYHHNLESTEAFYPQLCTTQRRQERMSTVRAARQAGFEICCGGLFGAGETWADRVAFAFELRDAGIDNIPINFLHPHPGTPLSGQPPLCPDEALRIIAVFRHILPEATLRVCGGRILALADREGDLFRAGANALMTGNYLTTKGRGVSHDLALLERLGLEPAP